MNIEESKNQDAPLAPKVYLILRSIGEDLKNSWIRVSEDIASAHAFAQAFLINKFHYLYTELEIFGVTERPVPDTVYLAMAQKQPRDLQTMGLGLFRTMEEAKTACFVMGKGNKDFNIFQVTTCHTQLGLTEEDDKLLESLAESGVELQLKEVEKESSEL